MTAKPETAAEVRKPAGVIETHHDNAETEWGYSFTSHNPDPADYVRCYSEADAWKLADSLERALSAQGEAVARPVAWYVFADTEHWVTMDDDEAAENRGEGCQVRPLVFGDLTHPAPARVTEEARARHMDAVKEALSRWPEALPAIHFMSAALGPHDPITADDIAWAAAALEADHG